MPAPAIRPILLIVNGLPRSGKDTFADIIVEQHRKRTAGTSYKVSSVTHVYSVFKHLGIPIDPAGDKTPAQRHAMSEIKRVLDELCDYSTQALLTTVSNTLILSRGGLSTLLVAFVREPHAINNLIAQATERFAEHGLLVKTALVRGRGDTSAPSKSDAPEAVEDVAYDLFVNNGGTIMELHEGVVEVLDALLFEARGGEPVANEGRPLPPKNFYRRDGAMEA